MKRIFLFLLFIFEICAYSGTPPKNIIILIGDGMGVNYVSTSVLSMKNDAFRRFTSSGFSVTCSADNLVTDSGAGATAISTGYRTYDHGISVRPESFEPMFTIFELAEKFNKSTGIVVTCSITHATPAAFVSHVKDRGEQLEIARQETERKTDFFIGGGLKFFTPKSLGGDRADEVNLIDKIKNNGYDYYNTFDKLKEAKPGNKFYALFEPDGLPKAADRDYTLGDLSKIALDYLNKHSSNGFVLMIEGSQIDWAGHQNKADYLLSEMKDFNTALNTVLDFAEQDGETLVLVTADHETGGMNIVGGDLNGCNLDLKFSTKDHTPSMVGIFAKGPGEEEFRGVMDNFMIGRKLFKLVDSNYQF